VEIIIYPKSSLSYNLIHQVRQETHKEKKRKRRAFLMKKKALAVLLTASVIAGTMGGTATIVHADEEGKVINIYSWNDEFRQRLEAVYPEVKETSKDGTVTTLKDGTEIHWIINPNQDGVYQQKLDEALMNQADASADDKVDIFLSETDYVYKYTDAAADVAMPLKDLGIDPDKDLADQYDFTKTTASDADGVQRGSTWQCCPGLLVYRRDIAKDVFGTDDPEEVGKKMKDWDTAKATAEELKAKGYYTFASYADTFRLYGNSISQPWVEDGATTVNVDQQVMNWIKDSKEWLDAGYLNKTVKGQWNDDWNKAMGSESKVFAFLFPAWGIDFTLKPNWDGEDGAWAVTNPPQEYNWGGSYIHAATGTDNPEHAKDIILALTGNKDNLLKISKDYSDFTNTKSGMQEVATDDTFASDFLGGQNPFEYFAPVAENIKIAPLSAYDQGCVELLQNAFSDYFQGQVDYDKAKSNFETAIKERYPEIQEVNWAE
jgi:multiple sugar transport system substrate-binding protein